MLLHKNTYTHTHLGDAKIAHIDSHSAQHESPLKGIPHASDQSRARRTDCAEVMGETAEQSKQLLPPRQPRGQPNPSGLLTNLSGVDP